MPSTSLAEQFFRQCREAQDPLAFFQTLIDAKKPETEWLDFKQEPRDDANLKEIWYKALSGFANTEGGVLFFGIKAVKNAEGIDAAESFTPITDYERVAIRLRELAREGTNPPIQGVQILPVSDGQATKQGFIVCFIPESGNKPHRAETKDSKQYFIRASDSFQVANPALLRTLFHPSIHPQFEIESDLSYQEIQEGNNAGRFQLECRIAMKNVGTGTAHDCMVHFDHFAVANKSIEDFKPRWVDFENNYSGLFLNSTGVIHPEFSLRICSLKWTVHAQQVWSSTNYNIPAIDKFEIEMSIYARDMTPQKLRLLFEGRFFRGRRSIEGVVLPPRTYG